MLIDSGGTLGGAVASGLSGPGRFRFGGLRDFILGVRFVDGTGRLLKMGGKVVKNAAGFDLPKFFVGSLGRFGVLAAIVFKVFPRPASTLTLNLSATDVDEAAKMLISLANTRWEPEALDLIPGQPGVFMRLGSAAGAVGEIANDVLSRWPGRVVSQDESAAIWSRLREFGWAHPGGVLIKAATTPTMLPRLIQCLDKTGGSKIHASAGGNMAYISLPEGVDVQSFDLSLREIGASGLTLRGSAPLWTGLGPRPVIVSAVKEALDPQGRFPSLDE
jgi:glycolate oxidase FAD binding subunit